MASTTSKIDSDSTRAKHPGGAFLDNYSQLQKLKQDLERTVKIIEKSKHETEVEWLQLLSLTNQLKRATTNYKEVPSTSSDNSIYVEDDVNINKIPLNINQSQSNVMHEFEEEFDSD